MQLSFVYAATVFAAAWASPVPDSANQAVVTQSLSERWVSYYEDDLQATSFSITNWLHSKHIKYYRVGGIYDSDSFTDVDVLSTFDVAPTIKQVVLLTGSRVNHVKLSGFFNSPLLPSVPYDAPHGHDAQSLTNPLNTMNVHLDLADGEWFNLVRVQSIPFGPGAADGQLVYIRLETNFNNKVEAGLLDPSFGVKDFLPPKGYSRVVGFHGTDGDWLDSIGPVWA